MRKVIDFRNLDFHYSNQTKLLSNINLQLKTGSIHGLLGKNGEGKSTLLKLACGLLFPISGQIDALGFNSKQRNPLMLREIFFLPEEIQDSNLSIENYEKVYAPFYPDFSSSYFYKLLNEFTIDTKIKNINELSLGQKKKIMIAFGLATNSKLVLLDEPTNGLDIPSKRQFRRMISAAMNEKTCIVISTHQVSDLDDLIDQLIIMDQHEIVFKESVQTITSKLLFKSSEKKDLDELTLYSEQTPSGYNQVRVNTTGEENKLDIELLFNAILSDKQNIKKLLNSTPN